MERALLLIDSFSQAGRCHEAVPGGESSLQRSHCGGRMLWQPRLDGEQRCRHSRHSAQLLVSQLQRQEDCRKRKLDEARSLRLHTHSRQRPCTCCFFRRCASHYVSNDEEMCAGTEYSEELRERPDLEGPENSGQGR